MTGKLAARQNDSLQKLKGKKLYLIHIHLYFSATQTSRFMLHTLFMLQFATRTQVIPVA